MHLAEKLKSLLEGRNKTNLAEELGVSRSVLSKYANRGSTPPLDVALKLARILDVPLDWLVDDEADFPPPEVSGRQLRDYSDVEIMTEVARRLAHSVFALRQDLIHISGMDWHGIASRLYEAELGQADRDTQADIDMAEAVFARITSLNRQYDPAYYTERLPAEAGGRSGKQVLEEVAILMQAATALREDNEAFGQAMKYRSVIATAERPDWADLAEAERQATVERLSKLKPQRSVLKIDGNEVAFIDYGNENTPPTLRAAKTADPRRG